MANGGCRRGTPPRPPAPRSRSHRGERLQRDPADRRAARQSWLAEGNGGRFVPGRGHRGQGDARVMITTVTMPIGYLTARMAGHLACNLPPAAGGGESHVHDLRLAQRAHRCRPRARARPDRSEEHTSELQSPCNLVCRLLLEKKKK